MIIEKRNGCCSAPFQYFAKKQYIQKKKKRKNAIAIFFQLFSQLIYLPKLRKFIERIPSAKIYVSKVYSLYLFG